MHIAFLPILAFIFFLIGHYVGWSQGFESGLEQAKTEAVDRGHALYCPKTGNFAWEGECQE